VPCVEQGVVFNLAPPEPQPGGGIARAVSPEVLLDVGLAVILVRRVGEVLTAARDQVVNPGEPLRPDEALVEPEAIDNQVVGGPADRSREQFVKCFSLARLRVDQRRTVHTTISHVRTRHRLFCLAQSTI
jgi:hypothetical protein